MVDVEQRHREEAARAWCAPTTSGIEMDARLAEVFASMLATTDSAAEARGMERAALLLELWADAENAVRALQSAFPVWTTGCDDVRYQMLSADYSIALDAALKTADAIRAAAGGTP